MKPILVSILAMAIVAIPSASHPSKLPSKDGCMKNGCHSKLLERLEKVDFQHAPARDGACTICHYAHNDNVPIDKSLRLPIAEVCFGCHAEFGNLIRESRFVHTLVKQDRCAECHTPHASRYTKLRKNYYPPSEWDPFAWSGVTRMCMECHSPNITLEENTISGTGFRNGTINLHLVHLTQKKGRTCVACHAMHASDQEYHLRPYVPFGTGGWKLPLNYTKTFAGGSCVIGCHRKMAYDREKPVNYEPLIKPSRKSEADKQ